MHTQLLEAFHLQWDHDPTSSASKWKEVTVISSTEDASRASPNHNTQSPEVMSKVVASCEEVDDSSKSLREKLSAARLNISAKEDLVKQHAKVAEEAVSEPDATAALLQLRQKEQEVERKAKRQFKGLFDKNPGEISNIGTDLNENPKPEDENHESDDGPDSQGDEVKEIHEAEPPHTGLFS